MKKILKLIAAALCLAGAFFFFTGNGITAYAQNLQQLRNQRDEVMSNLNRARQDLNATRNQRTQLEFQIARFDMEIEWAHMIYEHYTEWVEWAFRELEILEALIERATIEYNEQHARFQARVRDLNQNDTFGFNYLEILLNANSVADALVGAEMISLITEQDRELTDSMRAIRHYLAFRQNEADETRTMFETLRYEQMVLNEQKEALLQEKEATLLLLLEQEAMYAEFVGSYEEDSRAIEAIIRRHEEELLRQQIANNPYVGGEMMWPLPGIPHTNITSRFGMRTHPITRRRQHHNGLDIRAPRGTEIVAANAGTVIFSGWQGSFGNLVLIDHGGGIITAYAHASTLVASRGDRVVQGQTVARVGSTGSSTGNHLHFEVRVGGRHENPEYWLRPR